MANEMHHTMNPVPSKNPCDGEDNMIAFDLFSLSKERTFPDRLKNHHLTLAGMGMKFEENLALMGYLPAGPYEAGTVIDGFNKYIVAPDGQAYILLPGVPLPYTVTGDWVTEQSNFKLVGDNSLRGDLRSPSGPSHIGYKEGTLEDFLDGIYAQSVSLEKYGAKCDGVTDDTAAFIDAAIEAKDRGLPLLGLGGGPGYLITSAVDLYTETDIRAPIILPADGSSRYIQIKTEKQPISINFESLSGLTHGSSKITGLPSGSAGRFLMIESNEILTKRNDGIGSDPYYKNTAVYIQDGKGNITPALDMGFNAGYNTTVKIIPIETRLTVRIHSFVFDGDGDAQGGIRVLRDSVDLHVGGFSAENSQNRTHIGLFSNDCNIYATNLEDADYAGYGYGILVGLSCKTNIYNVKGATSRTEIDGRHGSLVSVYDSFVKRAGSHWGNQYVFHNCHVDIYSYSGVGLEVLGGSYSYISSRGDVSYCEGNLKVKGSTWKVKESSSMVVPSAATVAGFFDGPRRLFDFIVIDDLTIEGGSGMSLTLIGGGSNNNYNATFAIPRVVSINNLVGDSVNTYLNFFNIPLDNVRPYPHVSQFRFSNVVLHSQGVIELVCRPYGTPTPAAISWKLKNCGTVNIRVSANAIEDFLIEDSKVIGFKRPEASAAKGAITLSNCTYAPTDFSYNEAPKIFKNVEFVGDVTVGNGIDGKVLYQVGCVAKKGATGYKTPLNYYVDTNIYNSV